MLVCIFSIAASQHKALADTCIPLVAAEKGTSHFSSLRIHANAVHDVKVTRSATFTFGAVWGQVLTCRVVCVCAHYKPSKYSRGFAIHSFCRGDLSPAVHCLNEGSPGCDPAMTIRVALTCQWPRYLYHGLQMLCGISAHYRLCSLMRPWQRKVAPLVRIWMMGGGKVEGSFIGLGKPFLLPFTDLESG